VADFSRNLTQQPFAFNTGHLHSGAQFFQLRGLGFDTTLVLINGRRVPPSANSIYLNAVDTNNIPLTAVERIEVMSDSASAIYGADAIGGVVNIILKEKVEQPEVYLHYGEANGGGEQRRVGFSLGATADRLKSLLVLDYSELAELMGEERDLWRNQDYRRFGGRDYRVTTANPGNVYSLTGQPLPGLSSSSAAIPSGALGGKLAPADFVATAGALNLESAFADASITPRVHRASAYGSAEYSFGANYSVFGEILAANSESTALRAPPSLSRQPVPASNPFNPFGVPVAVDYSLVGMDPISFQYDTDLVRVVGGGRGRIGQWEWEIAGMRHEEDALSTTRGGLDPLRTMAAINSADPQAALNLFSDGPAGSPALLDSLVGAPQLSDYSFSSSQLTAFIRGPLFNVGERKAELVVGTEWRRDAAAFSESGKRLREERDISSVFSEVRIPLLDELSLKIAARGDDYGDGEQAVNPQYGFTWRPTKDWLFRAMHGTSFRPPSLFELYTPILQPPLLIPDPLRGGEISNVTLIVGGNRDLDVVTARSFTTGFVFSPSAVPGWRLGASYWRVVMENRIIAPIYQELLKPNSPFNSLVVRDPPSGQDQERGWAGRLRSINLTRMNYGDLETSGIDLDTSLLVERPWGCLKFDLAVTWIDEYLSRDMNQVLPLDRVGMANVAGTIPEWRIVGTLGWKFGDFGLSTTTTFTPSYQDADLERGALDRRLSSQALVDMQAWLDLKFEGNALLDGSTLTLGARNVFDEAPEFANAGVYLGYDFSQSDLTRRFLYFRVSKRF
jgi:iron complex outermembrane receptor protein